MYSWDTSRPTKEAMMSINTLAAIRVLELAARYIESKEADVKQ